MIANQNETSHRFSCHCASQDERDIILTIEGCWKPPIPHHVMRKRGHEISKEIRSSKALDRTIFSCKACRHAADDDSHAPSSILRGPDDSLNASRRSGSRSGSRCNTIRATSRQSAPRRRHRAAADKSPDVPCRRPSVSGLMAPHQQHRDQRGFLNRHPGARRGTSRDNVYPPKMAKPWFGPNPDLTGSIQTLVMISRRGRGWTARGN